MFVLGDSFWVYCESNLSIVDGSIVDLIHCNGFAMANSQWDARGTKQNEGIHHSCPPFGWGSSLSTIHFNVSFLVAFVMPLNITRWIASTIVAAITAYRTSSFVSVYPTREGDSLKAPESSDLNGVISHCMTIRLLNRLRPFWRTRFLSNNRSCWPNIVFSSFGVLQKRNARHNLWLFEWITLNAFHWLWFGLWFMLTGIHTDCDADYVSHCQVCGSLRFPKKSNFS